MIKMILADDEPVITRGIQKLVDWQSLGIQIVGEYQDGMSALHGIISLKPEIALLDISMPKKTGLDILEEVRTLGLETKIIFITGFEEFEYVRKALSYGAVDYLLKPIKKDELISTIEKCIVSFQDQVERREDNIPTEAYQHLVEIEETTYQPIAVEILYDSKTNVLEKRLIKFSVFGYIEAYLQKTNTGIIFYKNNDIVVVLKGVEEEEQVIINIINGIFEQTNNRIAVIMGDIVNDVSEIPQAYQRCTEKQGYFFFADFLKAPIIYLGGRIFLKDYSVKDMKECREKMIDAIFSQSKEEWNKEFEKLKEIICIISGGKKEDASFHYCSSIRIIEERFEKMSLPGLGLELGNILEEGRLTTSFTEMTCLYKKYFESYMPQIKKLMLSNDNKDIIKAKNYIETHYKEKVSLEILAEHVYMNPYYFSSFFKKQTGENFTDYLNKVRMKQAMTLLLSTDKRTYEIADKVGFRDARRFSELFQRYYGETPSNYRKRLKEK